MAGKSFDRFRFRSEQGCFLHSQPSFSPAGLSFVLCSFGCLSFGCLVGLGKLSRF